MKQNKLQCNEVGCTREWTHELELSALSTLNAPVKMTKMVRKVCESCAQVYKRFAEVEVN